MSLDSSSEQKEFSSSIFEIGYELINSLSASTTSISSITSEPLSSSNKWSSSNGFF